MTADVARPDRQHQLERVLLSRGEAREDRGLSPAVQSVRVLTSSTGHVWMLPCEDSQRSAIGRCELVTTSPVTVDARGVTVMILRSSVAEIWRQQRHGGRGESSDTWGTVRGTGDCPQFS